MATKNIGVVITAMREEIEAQTTIEVKIAHKAAGSTSHSTSDPPSGRTGLRRRHRHESALLQKSTVSCGARSGIWSLPVPGWTTGCSLPRCRAPPGGARLPDVLGHGVVEGAEEPPRTNRVGEVVALHLVAHRILQFGKDQRDATLVQPGVQFPERVGGGDVHVGDRLGSEDEPPEVPSLLSDGPDSLTEDPCIGEDQ